MNPPFITFRSSSFQLCSSHWPIPVFLCCARILVLCFLSLLTVCLSSPPPVSDHPQPFPCSVLLIHVRKQICKKESVFGAQSTRRCRRNQCCIQTSHSQQRCGQKPCSVHTAQGYGVQNTQQPAEQAEAGRQGKADLFVRCNEGALGTGLRKSVSKLTNGMTALSSICFIAAISYFRRTIVICHFSHALFNALVHFSSPYTRIHTPKHT